MFEEGLLRNIPVKFGYNLPCDIGGIVVEREIVDGTRQRRVTAHDGRQALTDPDTSL